MKDNKLVRQALKSVVCRLMFLSLVILCRGEFKSVVSCCFRKRALVSEVISRLIRRNVKHHGCGSLLITLDDITFCSQALIARVKSSKVKILGNNFQFLFYMYIFHKCCFLLGPLNDINKCSKVRLGKYLFE